MYKMILQDYLHNIKGSLKNTDVASWLFYFYPTFCLLSIGDMTTKDEICFILFILPFVFSLMLSRMYGGRMSKTFYLCPLSGSQRTEYIKKGIRLRILCSICLFLLLNGMLFAMRWLSPNLFFLKLFSMTCASISHNMYCQPIVSSPEALKRVYPLIGNYELFNIPAQVFGILSILLLSLLDGKESLWEFILIGLCLLLQLIFCIQMVRKFYRQILKQSAFYETITTEVKRA